MTLADIPPVVFFLGVGFVLAVTFVVCFLIGTYPLWRR